MDTAVKPPGRLLPRWPPEGPLPLSASLNDPRLRYLLRPPPDPPIPKLPGLKSPLTTPLQSRLVSRLWPLVSHQGGRRRQLSSPPTASRSAGSSLFHGSPASQCGEIPQCHPSLSVACGPRTQFVRPSQEEKRLSSSVGLFSSTLKSH